MGVEFSGCLCCDWLIDFCCPCQVFLEIIDVLKKIELKWLLDVIKKIRPTTEMSLVTQDKNLM